MAIQHHSIVLTWRYRALRKISVMFICDRSLLMPIFRQEDCLTNKEPHESPRILLIALHLVSATSFPNCMPPFHRNRAIVTMHAIKHQMLRHDMYSRKCSRHNRQIKSFYCQIKIVGIKWQCFKPFWIVCSTHKLHSVDTIEMNFLIQCDQDSSGFRIYIYFL